MRPDNSRFMKRIISLMPGVGSCGVCTKTMEALLVWSACGCVHIPQKSPVRVHTKGVESPSAIMVQALEVL